MDIPDKLRTIRLEDLPVDLITHSVLFDTPTLKLIHFNYFQVALAKLYLPLQLNTKQIFKNFSILDTSLHE